MSLATTPADQIAKWPAGKRLQVVFQNGEKTIGRLGASTSDGFLLKPDKGDTVPPREVRFAEIRSVQSKWTVGEKWLAAGLIYGGITLLFGVLLGA